MYSDSVRPRLCKSSSPRYLYNTDRFMILILWTRMTTSHHIRWHGRLARKMSAQRFLIRARPVQRLTNDTQFHVQPAGGTCIKQSVELGVTVHTNTKPFIRSPAPNETAKQSFWGGLFGLLRSTITSHDAAISTILPRGIARIAVLVVLHSRLKYVSALRNPLGDLIVIIACRGCP